MKKSEALKLIEEAIDAACGNDGEQRLYPTDDDLAYAALTAMLKAGMVPPTMEFMMGDKLVRDNCWEPEDG